MLKKVYTSNAPEAIGPYSQAIICGNMLFTSGQIPINPATGEVEAEGITDQATQVMKNLSAVLTEAGTSFDKVVKTTYDGSKVTLYLDFEGNVVKDCLVESDSLDCDIENKISKEILGKNLDVDSGEIIDRIKEEIYGV